MTVYRANYGDAFYGQDIYGLSGSIVDASASVSLVCAVSSEAVNVRNAASTATIATTTSALLQQVRIGASSAACVVSVTASGNRIIGGAASTASTSSASAAAIKVRTAAANIVCQGIIVAVAVEYPEVPGFRPGYGLNTYGSYIYGENHSIEEGAASIGLVCNVSGAGERIANAASNIALTSTATSNGVIDVVGRADVALSSSVNISYNRVRLMSATDNLSLTVNVLSRYKWLDADEPTTTWTLAPNPSNTWTEADYLERAA
jgi:hypothetical protein